MTQSFISKTKHSFLMGVCIIILLFNTHSAQAQVTSNDVPLHLYINLQGPYNVAQDSMLPSLTAYIPDKCPYDTTVFIQRSKDRMVDWVVIQAVRGDTRISKCACLNTNGKVTSPADTNFVAISSALGSQAQIRVRHRNHLSIITNPRTLVANTPIMLDIRASDTALIKKTNFPANVQNNAMPMIQLSNGKYALWAGDVNGNGEVKYQGSGNDRLLILNAIGGTNITNTISGYHKEDINLNSEVKYQGSGNDRFAILNNIGGTDITKVLVAHDSVTPRPFQCGDLLVYGDQSYQTVLMPDGKCWMAENLNIGTMITGATDMTNNGVIEKYCYNNSAANCTTYGGLYQWDEMMQYTTTEGAQGICPTGWHIPMDAEWTALTNALPTPDKGSRLAGNATLWFNGALDMSTHFGSTGFTVLPGGFRKADSSFVNQIFNAFLWSSTQNSTSGAWFHNLISGNTAVFRNNGDKPEGLSVRCVQD